MSTSDKTPPATVLSGNDLIRAAISVTSAEGAKAAREALQAWFARGDGQANARIVSFEAPGDSGASSELYLMEVEGLSPDVPRRLAVRVSSAFNVYPLADLALQVRCMRAAHAAGVLVPKVFWCELDPSFLGRPFYVMEQCSGRVTKDVPTYVEAGWLHDLSPKDRAVVWRNGIAAIASVHSTPCPDDLGPYMLPVAGDDPLDRMLNYWTCYRAMIGPEWDLAVIDAAIAYLRQHRPARRFEPGLVWGDASLRNMMFDDLRPSALLDFEFAHFGVRELDVAFYSLMDRVMAEGVAGVPRLSGFLDEAQTFDHYESITGYKIEDRRYFTIMASTYNSLAGARLSQRLYEKGVVSRERVGDNPGSKILRTLLRESPQ